MRLGNETDVAQLLAVSVATIRNYRLRGGGPPYLKLGEGRRGPVRYDLDAAEAWARRNVREHTSHEAK